MKQDYAERLPGDVVVWIVKGREAWRRRDFDSARIAYQKAAYAITSVGGFDDEKALHKEEQTAFASADPRYHQIIDIIRPLVEASPGIMQSALYPGLPFEREEIARTLYYAHELGHIRREKKGRSYALFVGA